MNRIFLSLLISLSSLTASAQYEASEFITPPMQYRPVPLWFWNNDRIQEQQLLDELTSMVEKDFYGGAAILPFGQNFRPEYLSEDYFNLYSKAIEKARSLGAHMSVYDEYGFPSGSMGAINGDGVTRFMNNHPGHTIHRLDKYEYSARSGKTYTRNIDFPGKLMAVAAYKQSTKEVIPLSEYITDGVLTWPSPGGIWKVIFFVSVVDGDPNVDYLSPESVKLFINDTHEQYYQRFPEAFGETITSTFFDEPTMYRANGRMWTDDFNEKFEARYGFSPERLYPALWYDIGEETAAARNMLFGMRAQLYAEGFMKTLAEWAESHGIMSTGHQDNEEILNPTSISGDLMLCGKYMTMPGIDKIGGNRPAENFYKVVSSSANNWDHTLVMSETFGDMGNISTETLYRIATEQYTKGINYLIPHAVWYNDNNVTFLPELSWRNPLYNKEMPKFNRFLARLRYVLARPGQHVADVAVLYPIQTQQSGHYLDGPLGYYQGGVAVDGTDYTRVSQILTDELGRDFTYLHPEVLDDRCTVEDGILTMTNPVNTEHFSIIILPGVKTISMSNLRKIHEAWKQGALVIFTTQTPSESATLDATNEEIKAIVDEMLDEDSDNFPALFVSNPSAVLLSEALAMADKTPDVEFVRGVPFNYIHKVIEGQDVYYFGNIDGKTSTCTIRLRNDISRPMLMNPRTGEIKEAEINNGELTIALAPTESVFLIENGPEATDADVAEQNADSYTISLDFRIEKLSAGIAFAARDEKNFYMWQFNAENENNPTLRPHIWFGGNVELLDEISLKDIVNLNNRDIFHVRIEVTEGCRAKTFINDVLVDERYGNFAYGMVGFRQDHSDAAGSEETALFDNVCVTTADGKTKVFEDDFSITGTYNRGTVVDGWLRVVGSWNGHTLAFPKDFDHDALVNAAIDTPSMPSADSPSKGFYTLSGIALPTPPQQGLYIQSGKKYLHLSR